jgi:uncharacterized RDD family membrane protein YckC
VKNDGTGPKCFVCEKPLPNMGDGGITPPPRRISLSPTNRSSAPRARMRNRLLALVLDAVFIGAVLLIIAAVLWSKLEMPKVSVLEISPAIAAVALFGMLCYTWVLEGAFGATIGRAFAGVRVVQQEEPLSRAKRIGVITTWILLVAGAIWGAVVICPQWFRL